MEIGLATSGSTPPEKRDLQSVERTELGSLVWRFPRAQLANDFGVSDITIRRQCKKLGIAQPPSGYWQRVGAGRRIDEASIPAEWLQEARAGQRAYAGGDAKEDEPTDGPEQLDSEEEKYANVSTDIRRAASTFGLNGLSWPSLATKDLRRLVWALPFVKLAEALEVSDVLVARRCRASEIARPPSKYWNSVRAGRPVDESSVPVDLLEYARRCREAYRLGHSVPRWNEAGPAGLSPSLRKTIDGWAATLNEASRTARRSHIKMCLLAGGLLTVGDVQGINFSRMKKLNHQLEEKFVASTAAAYKAAFRSFRTFLVDGEPNPVSESVEKSKEGFEALFDVAPLIGRPAWIPVRDGAIMGAAVLGGATIEDLCQMPKTAGGSYFSGEEAARALKMVRIYRARLPQDFEETDFMFVNEDGGQIYRKLVERIVAERTKSALGQKLSLTEVRALSKFGSLFR